MKPITKSSAYAYLNRIKTESNGSVNISPYMHKVASNEIVPTDVLIFINKHIDLPQLYTYNEIYRRRAGQNKSPLFKNIMNETLDDENKAIVMSSILTQTFIHTKQLIKENKQDDVVEYAELMNVPAITEALNDYARGNATKLNEVFYETREVFVRLFK